MAWFWLSSESGEWETAEVDVNRFDPLNQPLAQESCRSYLLMRRGRQPKLAYTGTAPLGTYDLFRYWNLEFRFALGEEPDTLLPDVETERGKASEEYRGLVRSLAADLLMKADRTDEALTTIREAHAFARADLRRHPVARAHLRPRRATPCGDRARRRPRGRGDAGRRRAATLASRATGTAIAV